MSMQTPFLIGCTIVARGYRWVKVGRLQCFSLSNVHWCRNTQHYFHKMAVGYLTADDL